MDLAHAVLDYYLAHAGELPPEKRFHLANRLFTWNGDERAKALLAGCRPAFVPDPVNDETLTLCLESANQETRHGLTSIVAYGLRKPYFDRYPTLIGLEAELFRLRHWRALYGIDATAPFLKRHPLSELRGLEQSLLADTEALRILSTWPVNFLYLLHVVLLGDENINPEVFYRLGSKYDTGTPEQLRLHIYLYTHCIIADSNFYARPLPPARLEVYHRMLAELGNLIETQLEQTSLDTKLEFLVCCRLAHYRTGLEEQLYNECAQSVSPQGTFLVDTHNIFKGITPKMSFEASEHRNVLFVMSVLPRGATPAVKND